MSLRRVLDFLLGRPGLAGRITELETTVSNLTDAVARLTASVDAAGDRFTALITPLQTALVAAQEQVAALQLDDEADKAAIEASLAEANNAAAALLVEADQLDQFGGTPDPEPTPDVPADPEAPVDPEVPNTTEG